MTTVTEGVLLHAASDLVKGLVGEADQVEVVDDDRGVGQPPAHGSGVGLVGVDRDVFDAVDHTWGLDSSQAYTAVLERPSSTSMVSPVSRFTTWVTNIVGDVGVAARNDVSSRPIARGPPSAVMWLARARASSRTASCDGVLFLSNRGRRFTSKRLGVLTRAHLDAAGIDKPGACHLYRHTAATLMLEGGADLRYVQELLGNADISTTTIYTRVSIRRLKAVHAACHPGARTSSRSPSLDRDGDDAIAAHLETWLNEELAAELDTLDDEVVEGQEDR